LTRVSGGAEWEGSASGNDGPAILVTGRAHGPVRLGEGHVRRWIRGERRADPSQGPGVRSPPLMEATEWAAKAVQRSASRPVSQVRSAGGPLD
jgi:hypothetical protein